MKSEILHIPVTDVVPHISDILQAQGVPRGVKPNGQIRTIADEALGIFQKLANPVGILMEIGKKDFADVFAGEGENDGESPVNPIAQNADRLALYAVTIGQPVCAEIARLFRVGEYPLGAMLDAAASEGTELTARFLETYYRARLKAQAWCTVHHGTLRFSPGYCGWRVSGQKKLFASLKPGAIGITLNDSCLMQPLKSISGVVIAGKKEIFEFDDTFSFCADCTTHVCRDRIIELMDQ